MICVINGRSQRTPSPKLALLAVGMLLLWQIASMAADTPEYPELIESQRWVENEKNPVFVLPPKLGHASFPCALYSATRFGEKKGSFYRMWFDTQKGLYVAHSLDGVAWKNVRPAGKGLQNPMQGKVLYDAKCFGKSPYCYRIWYVDSKKVPREPLRTAWSKDGIEWEHDTTAPGVYVVDHKWSQRGYGVVTILYHPQASPGINLEEPMKSRFLLFYECFLLTANGMCDIALAVSGDGERFTIVGEKPVLQCSGRDKNLWDADYATFGSIVEMNGKLHAWYSGGHDEHVDLLFSGVGYAVTDDAVHWEKAAFNPILKWKEAKWRWGTAAMPQVLYDPQRFAATGERNGPRLKMFLCGSDNSKFFTPQWHLGVGILSLSEQHHKAGKKEE